MKDKRKAYTGTFQSELKQVPWKKSKRSVTLRKAQAGNYTCWGNESLGGNGVTLMCSPVNLGAQGHPPVPVCYYLREMKQWASLGAKDAGDRSFLLQQ